MVWGRDGPQFLHVEQVLFASGCDFVSDKVVSRDDDGGNFAINQPFQSMLPCFIEGDSVNALKNVDA